MKEAIQIACASDQRYFTGLLGTIASLLVSLNKEYHINLNVLDGGITDKSKNILEKVVSRFNPKNSIQWIKTDTSMFSAFPDFFYNSKMTYARLLLPELLSEKKIIYIDTDILFLKDISQLWNLSLNDHAALVAREVSIGEIQNDCPRWESLGFEPTSPYFNAGLMVLNLDKFRAKNIHNETLKWLHNYPEACDFHDQSALNVTLYGDFQLIDQKWNVQSHRIAFNLEDDFDKLFDFDINYHFVTSFKPWLFYNDSPQNLLFYKIVELVSPNSIEDEFLESVEVYKLKKKLYRLMPTYYTIRSYYHYLRKAKRAYDADKKIAGFWQEQIPMLNYQNSIREKTNQLVINWEEKIKNQLADEF